MNDWCFQLYSARHVPLDDALALVSTAGYRSVEAYGDSFADPDALQAALQLHGLSLPSAHVSLVELRAQPDACIALARRFGIRHLVCPYLLPAQRPADRNGWQHLARELTLVAQRMSDAGLQFAWHNHDFEFQPLADGTVPMQVLLDEADGLCWEMDVAWVERAGAQVDGWIARYGQRLSAVHVKDIAAAGEGADEDGWADVGQGTVAWPALLDTLRQTPAALYVVEHDNPANLLRFATRSIAYLRDQAVRLAQR